MLRLDKKSLLEKLTAQAVTTQDFTCDQKVDATLTTSNLLKTMAYSNGIDFSTLYLQSRVHQYTANSSFLMSAEVLSKGIDGLYQASVSLKVYTSAFSLLDINIAQGSTPNEFIATLGSTVTCSTSSNKIQMAQSILYTLTCQSKSMVFGEVMMRVDRLAEDFYSKCSSTVAPPHQYTAASLDEQGNPTQTPVTITLNSVQLLRFTFLTSFKTLDSLRTTKDIPNILHLRHSISYSFSDPAFDTGAPLPSLGILLSALNHSAYNCPKNCLLCSEDVYPNGKCYQCSAVEAGDQNYDLRDGTSCVCTRNDSKVEDYRVVKLLPDDTAYDLAAAPNPAIQSDLQKALLNFANPSFFSYTCQPTSYYTQNACFNATVEFFDPKNLKIVALASARILTFDLSITNTAAKTLPLECSSSIKSTTFLLFQGDQSSPSLTQPRTCPGRKPTF